MLSVFDINILTKPVPCCKCLHVMNDYACDSIRYNIVNQPGLETRSSKCTFDVFTTESLESRYYSKDRTNKSFHLISVLKWSNQNFWSCIE